jgi:hypothetical protein
MRPLILKTIIVFSLLVIVSFAVPPASALSLPPEGNTPKSLNVGLGLDKKEGPLFVENILRVNDKFNLQGQTNTAVVSKTDFSAGTFLHFAVNGDLGAKNYCDETGQNCITTAQISELKAKNDAINWLGGCEEKCAQKKITSISLTPTSLNVRVNSTGKLTATVLPLDATNKTLSWTSSNGNVATVSDGTVACKAAGSATITVKAVDGSNKSASATVKCFNYIVTVITANAGGSFSPSTQYAIDNSTVSFTATLDTDYEITSVVLKSDTVYDTTTGRVNATKNRITLKPSSDVVLEVRFSRFDHFAGLTWQNDQNLFLCYDSWGGRNYGYCSAGNGLLTATNQAGGSGALEYCEFLNADGITLSTTRQRVWRLPKKTDFEAITDTARTYPATAAAGFTANDLYWTQTLDGSFETNARAAYYWASSNGSFNIFLHGFGNRIVGFNYRYGTMRVRCVK